MKHIKTLLKGFAIIIVFVGLLSLIITFQDIIMPILLVILLLVLAYCIGRIFESFK